MSSLAFAFAFAFALSPLFGEDQLEWRWTADGWDIFTCSQHIKDPYRCVFEFDPATSALNGETRVEISIKIYQKDDLFYERRDVHRAFPFVINGKRLFFAEYTPNATGCSVSCWDGSVQATLWKCYLKGLGPISHSKYSNAVNILFDSPNNRVMIYGTESSGRYIEALDAETGKTVANVVLPPSQ